MKEMAELIRDATDLLIKVCFGILVVYTLYLLLKILFIFFRTTWYFYFSEGAGRWSALQYDYFEGKYFKTLKSVFRRQHKLKDEINGYLLGAAIAATIVIAFYIGDYYL